MIGEFIMFRRTLYILLTSFCFMLIGNQVFAESEDGKEEILFKSKEITDNEELTKMFLNNEHQNIELGEFADSALQKNQTITLIPENNQELSREGLKEETIQIAPLVQLLEVRNDQDGLREEIYALSYFVDVEDDGDGFYTLSNKSRGDYKYDPSLSVRASSTIYIATKNDSSGVQHARLIRANGSWRVEQTGVNLSSRQVTYMTIGNSRFGSTKGQSRVKNLSSNSWSVTAPTWTHATGHVGASTSVKLSGRTSSTLRFCNLWFGGSC